MQISIAWRIVAAFSVALLSLIAIALASYSNLELVNRTTEWVVHTYEVLNTKESLERALIQVQSANRSYLITGEQKLRAETEAGIEDVQRWVGKLRQLTVDNPAAQARIDKLEGLISERHASIESLLQLHDQHALLSDPEFAGTFAVNAHQAQLIHALTAEMEQDERALLASRRATAAKAEQRTNDTFVYGSAIAVALCTLIALWLVRSIRRPLTQLSVGAARIASGEYRHRVSYASRDEIGALAKAFDEMAGQVEERQKVLSADAWLKSGIARLARVFEGQRDVEALSNSALSELAQLLEIQHGAFYVVDTETEQRVLRLKGNYAVKDAPETILPGERMAGQAYRERRRIVIDDLPDNYVHISSALGDAPARHLVVLPLTLNNAVLGVVELASFRPLDELKLKFLEQFADSTALVLNTVIVSARTDDLLIESQRLSASLEEQRAELAHRNDELETQGHELRASEEMLQQQQEELRQSNEELQQTNQELQQANTEIQERARIVAEQKRLVEQANLDLESARVALEEKSKQLTLTSKYKSEFLANMSHELRTPLNSLLILSKMLSENMEGTLTEKQVKHAQTIFASGNDLLRLIDDVLDLSKVEAGALELELEDVTVAEIAQSLEATFKPIAESRHLEFRAVIEPDAPPRLKSDGRRLQQILKNLLANALKFTHNGGVSLTVRRASAGWEDSVPTLASASSVLAFEVRDTGIGIPEDRQRIIFEAFQQAEAGTARKYGGTGLGLSISRELAARLGGTIKLDSVAGKGSVFTLYLPDAFAAGTVHATVDVRSPPPMLPTAAEPMETAPALPEPDLIADDRANIAEGDAVLLIIEDDRHFAYVLAECARAQKFKVAVAGTAAAGVTLARSLKPAAITLDLHLPDRDGRVVLDLLKHDPSTRHIPIHVISVTEHRERILRQGAVSFLQKPVTREALDAAFAQAAQFSQSRSRRLLIVEDDPAQQHAIREVIGNGDVESTVAASAREALEALDREHFDCLVLDLGLPDQNGVDLIREIHRRHGVHSPPVVIYTAKALSRREEAELRGLSDAIIVKDARSPERLLDETALFLHRVQAKLPASKRRLLERIQREDTLLSGRKVLVVDDDLRNIFAISTALENYKMVVSYAESGREALAKLDQESDVAAILMDVMMPEMDGFEATRRIRSDPRYAKLPIVMVTAKAMRGDREKCLEAGASDYITKPVDMDQLRSLLRVWLYT